MEEPTDTSPPNSGSQQEKSKKPVLKPATLDTKNARQHGFRTINRVQVAIVILAFVLIGLAIAQQHYLEKTKIQKLEKQIHLQLDQYKKLEKSLFTLTKKAQKYASLTENFAFDFSQSTPSFTVSDFSKRAIIYQRITRAPWLQNNLPDQFPDCLGISPFDLDELSQLQTTSFHQWENQLHEKNESIKLEVLTRRIRDQTKEKIDTIQHALKAKYLLILDEISLKHFRISVWDFSQDKLVFSQVVQPHGTFFSLGYGRKRSTFSFPIKNAQLQKTAQDCALASILKEWVIK